MSHACPPPILNQPIPHLSTKSHVLLRQHPNQHHCPPAESHQPRTTSVHHLITPATISSHQLTFRPPQTHLPVQPCNTLNSHVARACQHNAPDLQSRVPQPHAFSPLPHISHQHARLLNTPYANTLPLLTMTLPLPRVRTHDYTHQAPLKPALPCCILDPATMIFHEPYHLRVYSRTTTNRHAPQT